MTPARGFAAISPPGCTVKLATYLMRCGFWAPAPCRRHRRESRAATTRANSFDVASQSGPRPYAGSDRGARDHGERHVQRKAVVERLNLGVPDDGRQAEGRFEHGEVV